MADRHRQFDIELPLDKMLYFIIEMFVHDIVHDMHLATQLPRVLGVQTKLGRDFFPPADAVFKDTMVGTFGGAKRGAAEAGLAPRDQTSSTLSQMLSERDDNMRLLDDLRNLINSFNEDPSAPNLWISSVRMPHGAAAQTFALLAFNPNFVKGDGVFETAQAIAIGPTAFYINNTRVSPFLALPCVSNAAATHASSTNSACSHVGNGIYSYVYPDGNALEQATNGVLFQGPGGAGWILSYQEGVSLELRTNYNVTAPNGTQLPIVLSFIPASEASIKGLIADPTAQAAFIAANRGTITQYVLNETLKEIAAKQGGVSFFEQCLTEYPGQAFIRYAYLSQFFVDIIQSAHLQPGNDSAQKRLQKLESLFPYVWNPLPPPIVLGAQVASENPHLTETQITSSDPYRQWVTQLYHPLIEACTASVLQQRVGDEGEVGLQTELAGFLEHAAATGQPLQAVIVHVITTYGLASIMDAVKNTVVYLVPLYYGMTGVGAGAEAAARAGVAWNNPDVLLGAIYPGQDLTEIFTVVKNVLLRCVQVLGWIDAQLDKQNGSTGMMPAFAYLEGLGSQIGIPHLAVAALYIRSASDAIQQYEGALIAEQKKNEPDIEAASGIGESMENNTVALQQNQQILADVQQFPDPLDALGHLVTLVQGRIDDPKILYDAFLLGDYNDVSALALMLHLSSTAQEEYNTVMIQHIGANLLQVGTNLLPADQEVIGRLLGAGATNVIPNTDNADQVLNWAIQYNFQPQNQDPQVARQEVLGMFLDLYTNALMLHNGQRNLLQLEATRAAIEVEPGMEGGGHRRVTNQKGGAKSAAPIWNPGRLSFVVGIFNSALSARRSKASKFRGQFEVMLNMTEDINQVYRTNTVGNFGFSPNFRTTKLLAMGLPKGPPADPPLGNISNGIFQIADELQTQTWPILNTSMSDYIYRKMIDSDFVTQATTVTDPATGQGPALGNLIDNAIIYLETVVGRMVDSTNREVIDELRSDRNAFQALMRHPLKGAIYTGLTGQGYVNSNDELLEAVRAVEAFQNNISFVLSIAYMVLCHDGTEDRTPNLTTLVELENRIEGDTPSPPSAAGKIGPRFRNLDDPRKIVSYFASYTAAKLKAYRQLLKDAREILDASDVLYIESQIAFAFSMAGVAKSVTYPVGKFLTRSGPTAAALFDTEMKIIGPVLAGAAGWKKAGLVPTKSISGVDAASLRQFQNMMNNTKLRGDTKGHYVEKGKATAAPGKLGPGFIADLAQTVIGGTPAFENMRTAYQKDQQFFISNFVVAGGFLDFNDQFLCPMSSITDNQPTCSSIKSTTTKDNGILWAPMDVRIHDPANIFTYRIAVTYKKPTNPENPPNEVYIFAYLQVDDEVLINLGSMDEVQGVRSEDDLEYVPPAWPGGANPCIVAPTDGGPNQPMDAKQCLASVMKYLQKEGARGTDWAAGQRASWTRWLERLGDDATAADPEPAILRRGLMEAAFQKGLGDFLQELNGFMVQYGYTKKPKWSKDLDKLAAWQNIVAQFNNDQPSALRTLLFILFTRNDDVINPNAISGYLSKTKYLVATRSGKAPGVEQQILGTFPIRGGRKRRTLKKRRNKRKTRNKKRTAKKKPKRRTIQKKRKVRKNNKKRTRRNRKTK